MAALYSRSIPQKVYKATATLEWECQVWGEIAHRSWKVELEKLCRDVRGDLGEIPHITENPINLPRIYECLLVMLMAGLNQEASSPCWFGRGLARQEVTGWSRQINLHLRVTHVGALGGSPQRTLLEGRPSRVNTGTKVHGMGHSSGFYLHVLEGPI